LYLLALNRKSFSEAGNLDSNNQVARAATSLQGDFGHAKDGGTHKFAKEASPISLRPAPRNSRFIRFSIASGSSSFIVDRGQHFCEQKLDSALAFPQDPPRPPAPQPVSPRRSDTPRKARRITALRQQVS
jgi:hypothetical protein